MYGKSNMETYNTTCRTGSQWEFSVGLRELQQGLCDNLGGWDGKGDGREVQEGTFVYLWLIHVVWQKTTKFCKAIILQLKKKGRDQFVFRRNVSFPWKLRHRCENGHKERWRYWGKKDIRAQSAGDSCVSQLSPKTQDPHGEGRSSGKGNGEEADSYTEPCSGLCLTSLGHLLAPSLAL